MYTLRKHTKTLILAFLFCVLYSFSAFADVVTVRESAPLNPEFLQWQEDQQSVSVNSHVYNVNSSASGKTYAKGYIPSPVNRSHLSASTPKVNAGIYNVKASALPSAYDLRTYSKVTPVRDQNPYGTCWAFASIGAIESNYLSQGLSSSSNIDLSELHLSWFAYKDPERGNSFTISQSGYYYTNSTVLNYGGNVDISIAYLSRMAGPVKESSMPYLSAQFVRSDAKPSDYFPLALRLKDAYTLGDITTASERVTRIPVLKEFIMNNGAAVINYYAGNGAYTSSGTSVPAYFDNSGSYPDHAVLAVGWDDNFSRNNFTGRTKPSSNGAWLVKNSWGSNWGDSGYFWISYEQNIYSITSFCVGEPNDDIKHYGHDALGHIGSMSDNWAANVFKAERDNEAVGEAGFYTLDNNVNYEIYIYDLGTAKPSYPVPSNLNSYKAKISGTETYAGYHTKSFNKLIPISKDHYFSVVVNMNTSYRYPTAIEEAYMNYASPVINSGESWFASYSNGIPPQSRWTDGTVIRYTGRYSPANACIKAFTFLTDTNTPSVEPASADTEPEPTPTPTPEPTPEPKPTPTPTPTPTPEPEPTPEPLPSSYKAPKIKTSSLPRAVTGTEYTAQLKASGSEPMTWTAEGLPEGLTINSSTGAISGIPVNDFSGKFNASVSNLAGTYTKAVRITVKSKKPSITTKTLPQGTENQSYNVQLTATGSPRITWSYTGTLPKGLTLNSSGLIEGIPKEYGKFTIYAIASNSAGKAKRKLVLTIEENYDLFSDDDWFNDDWFNDDWWWWWFYGKPASVSSVPENVNSNGGNTSIRITELHVVSDDVLKQGTDRDEDIVEVRAGMPVRFIAGDSAYDMKVYVDDELIEDITVSENGEFTVPADIVHNGFKVQVKAKGFESHELYVNAIEQ